MSNMRERQGKFNFKLRIKNVHLNYALIAAVYKDPRV